MNAPTSLVLLPENTQHANDQNKPNRNRVRRHNKKTRIILKPLKIFCRI